MKIYLLNGYKGGESHWIEYYNFENGYLEI